MQPGKKTTYRAAPVWALAATLGALSCAGLVYYWYSATKNNQVRIKQLNTSITTSRNAVNGLMGNYSDQKAEQARADADRLRNSMMTGAEADSFVNALRPAWSVVARAETANNEFIKQRYQIARGSSPVSVWPEVIALFERMKEIDSLAVDAVEVQTAGDSRRREFSRISLTLTIYVKKPE